MSETAAQMARRLMGEVEAASKGSYSKGEVKTMLNTIGARPEVATAPIEDTCRAPVKLDALRRGDVFVAKLVGGKVRPWVVLKSEGGVVVALSMTSGDKVPGCVQSKCRLWPSSWISSTVSVFDEDFAGAEVTRPYTNLAHLAEVEAVVMGLYAAPRRVTSIAEIRARMHGDAA